MADSQADTQPANGINSQSQQIPEVGSWAKLAFPVKSNSSGCIWLKNDLFRFGKLPDCDYLADNVDSELSKGVSKIQFVIEKHDIRGVSVAYIRDLSSNGTFINGELIGKGEKRILGHKDTISIVKAEWKLCRFCYLSTNEQIVLPDQVKLNYHVLDMIGNGSINQVYFVLNKKTCLPSAMKSTNVSLNIHNDDENLKELRMLQAVKHANIIGYHGQILIDTQLFLFMEYMDGGDLSILLRRKGRLSEPLARNITRQIISGLTYLHSLKIAHRNIRPENILLDSNENNPTAKITNFRSSKILRKGVSSVDKFGTSVYDAPETKIHGSAKYDLRVDVWSLGVLLYVCLCGREPVEGCENNAGGKILYSPRDVWSEISCLAKKTVEATLVVDPTRRLSFEKVSSQPWFIAVLNLSKKRSNILTGNITPTPKRFKVNY